MALFKLDLTGVASAVDRLVDVLERIEAILDRAYPPPVDFDEVPRKFKVTRANPDAIRARQDLERTMRARGLSRRDAKVRADEILKARP